MRKHFFKYCFFIIIFLMIPVSVNASFGDLRYEITGVHIGNDSIMLNGWAFIHRTNNFNEVSYNGRTIVSGGDHKILVQAVNLTTNEVIETVVVMGSLGENNEDYNFYCELFDTSCHKYKDGKCVEKRKCDEYNYANLTGKQINNNCTNRPENGNGDSSKNGYCYYEDIGFSVKFNVTNWNVGGSDKIAFRIAASNNDFEYKINNPGNSSYYANFRYMEYDGDYYTIPESIYMHESLISNSVFETDFIKVDTNTFVESVAVIAKDSLLRYFTADNRLVYFKDNMFDHPVYSTYPDGNGFFRCDSNVFILSDTISGYTSGISDNTEQGLCKSFLGGNCSGSHNYAIYVENINQWYVCPSKTKSGFVAIVRGSHVKVSGDTVFQISVKNKQLCEVTDPNINGDILECNGNKTYNSTCEELMVTTSEGSARVKIEQTGNVSSVLTPDSIYAGGGFNFGIMYYNTIKWSYVPGQNIDSDLHTAVTESMNNKIKDYDAYIAGINISNLKMGGKVFNLVKQCTTSNNSKDYYNKELTVSCIFTIPSSDIDQIGNVDYRYDVNGFNINNKYYTPINYEGDYKITADIMGMDRITKSAAESDSKEEGKGWTGDWSDSFTNCEIDVYGLLMKNNVYNFIYRPIDIFKPFPNRNPGINWFDWMNVPNNVERLKNTYSDIDYTVNLDNKAIADIKNYNSGHNYLEWDSIDEITKESSFITEKDYIVRGGN